jgi:hypothetical protein
LSSNSWTPRKFITCKKLIYDLTSILADVAKKMD